MKRIKLLNCYIDNLTMKETVNKIEEYIHSGRPHQHVVVNAGKIVSMLKNKELFQSIIESDLVNADGQSIVWASKLLDSPLPERISGIDLMKELLRFSSAKGYKVYFLGAKKEVVEELVKICQAKYPDLEIGGYRNGYFSQAEEIEVVKEIKTIRPDILFVGISSPKKETFLKKYLKEMNVPFSMGVGGSFDVLAGKTKRAPKWMQNWGLEWFFRFVQEPLRLWRRYLVGNSIFIWLVLKEFFRIKILKISQK